MKKKILIEGMTCHNCVHHVSEALKELDGIATVDVNLEGKYAIVDLIDDLSENVIKEAIDEVGYKVVGIQEA